MATLKQVDEKVDKLAKSVEGIETALKGYNGQVGLSKQIENNTRAITKIWIVLALITASTGGGLWAIVNAILG